MRRSFQVFLLLILFSFCLTIADRACAQFDSGEKSSTKTRAAKPSVVPINKLKKKASQKTVHPTEEQKRWAGKAPEYSKTCKKLIALLRKGNLDGVLEESTINLENVEDQSNYIEEEIIPFFSDFHESGKVEFDSAHKANGKYDGFSIYRSFTTRKGTKKFYLVRVLERKGKPSISEIILNRKYEDDYPKSAKAFKKSHPQVEEIRPTVEPSQMWEAPKK